MCQNERRHRTYWFYQQSCNQFFKIARVNLGFNFDRSFGLFFLGRTIDKTLIMSLQLTQGVIGSFDHLVIISITIEDLPVSLIKYPGNNDGTIEVSSQLDMRAQKDAVIVRGLNEDHMSILTNQEAISYLN